MICFIDIVLAKVNNFLFGRIIRSAQSELTTLVDLSRTALTARL